MQTQTVSSFAVNVRARLNAGAPSMSCAIEGAIREGGPLRTARVSSAQAKGAAKKYAYWGAVRYCVTIRTTDGKLSNKALERASSDRRTVAGAKRDCDAMCESGGRLSLSIIGGVSAYEIAQALGFATVKELRALDAISAFARAC